MARTRIENFHDARFSVAQSAIRENIAQSPFASDPSAFGAEADAGANDLAAREPGLFANNPIMQAAGAVLDRMYRGEVDDASTAEAVYRARRQAQAAEGMMVAAAAGVAEDCLDLMTSYVFAWLKRDRAKMSQIENEWEFSPCNVRGGMKILQDWLRYYGSGAEPRYNPPTAGGPDPFPLPPPASPGAPLRVGVLGDWGTGEGEAQAVLDQLMRQAPDLIIHVGDVYYSGTRSEQAAVLAMLRNARAASGRNVPFYSVPGNHDYYSGGAGFYETLPLLNQGVPDAPVQRHSFWCLRNEAWQLQGMDTGYHDSDLVNLAGGVTYLRPDEAEWHRRQLGDAGGRQVILFSHHQLFSAFDPIGSGWSNPHLTKNLMAWRKATNFRLAGWLWGHEHVLGVYEVPGTLPALGRCVGNSAIPVFTDTRAYTPQPGGAPLQKATHSPDGSIVFDNGYVQTQPEDRVWASGFTMLELAGDGTGTASYWQVKFEGVVGTASSQLLWQEPMPAAAAG